MSPVATALPPPIASVVDSWYFPTMEAPGSIGRAITYANALMIRSGTMRSTTHGAYGNSGGTGSSLLTSGADQGVPGRQSCARARTTVTALGSGFQPAWTHTAYGPADDFNPGARLSPPSVVSVYEVAWANSDAVDNWPNDTTGFAFCLNNSIMTDSLPGGSDPRSGFGVFFNTDTAGGVQIDYLAWDGVADVERVPLPTGIVTDITQWNSMRFVVVSAGGGRPATVSVDINSVPLVSERVFGVDIPFPTSQISTALGYVFASVNLLGGGADIFYFLHGYNGRFKPNAQAVQPFGG